MIQTLLSAAAIKAAKDLQFEDVNVPEWGGALRLQQMHAEDAAAFSADVEASPNDGMFLMLVYSAVDADGKKMFTKEDIPELRGKNIDVLNKLQLIALRLNKMDAEGKAALKKELREALIGASPIDSPASSAT